MRNSLPGKHSVYSRLTAAGYEVIVLAPASAAETIRESFGATVESIVLGTRLTKLEQFSDFITKHLNMTRMQVLGSKYGLRHNLDKKTRNAYLHTVRVLISKTLGKWRWFRVSVAPRLHLWAYKKRPLKELFEKYTPDLVFIPNPGSTQGEAVVRECVRQGIPTVGMVGSWDHPHKRYQALHTDTVFVWSESLKEEMMTLQNYPEEAIRVVGAPHSDFFMHSEFLIPKEQFFREKGLDPQKKLFTLFSGTGRAPDEGDVVDILMKASQEGLTTEPVQVYVRTYPGDEKGDHAKFDQFAHTEGVYIDWLLGGKAFGPAPLNYFPDERYMSVVVSQFYYSDAIMSVYSSASVEASIFLKPSINISFDGYAKRPFEESVKRFVYQSHFDKLFNTGAVLEADSKEALIEVVNRVISDPHCNEENIKKLRETVCGVTDGRVGERMYRHIVAVLGEA